MEPVVIVIAAIAATAVLLIAVALAGITSSAATTSRIERYARRERVAAGGADAPAERDPLLAINRRFEELPAGARIARDLARADVSLRVGEYLLLWAISIVGVPALFLAGSLVLPSLASPLALASGALIGVLLPRLWIQRRQRARRVAFNRQLPDAVILIANTIRSGSSVLQAFDTVVRESEPPISEEFRRLLREVNLGLSLEEALGNVVRRIESDDLRLLATAIGIQYSVGGNLAEILDTIAATLRERVRIHGEIRALTAQQRLSGVVVGGLPFMLTAILIIVAPGYLAPMFRIPPGVGGIPLGVLAMTGGVVLMAIGFFWIRRIVDIKV
jgi:tight adherence protein B